MRKKLEDSEAKRPKSNRELDAARNRTRELETAAMQVKEKSPSE